MAEITVDNVDGRILEDLTDALALARIAGEPVFAGVDTTTGEEQTHHLHLAGPIPKAMVRYVSTDETGAVDDRRHGVMAIEMVMATRLGAADDAGTRISEMLRLINAAKNAIETTPPADAVHGGEPSRWRPRLQWGRPQIDADAHAPWVVSRIKLEVSYMLDSPTSH